MDRIDGIMEDIRTRQEDVEKNIDEENVKDVENVEEEAEKVKKDNKNAVNVDTIGMYVYNYAYKDRHSEEYMAEDCIKDCWEKYPSFPKKMQCIYYLYKKPNLPDVAKPTPPSSFWQQLKHWYDQWMAGE